MPFDPKDIEFREHSESKKNEEARLKINILNLLLAVYSITAIWPVFYRSSTSAGFNSLLFGFLSIAAPILIVLLYPAVKQSCLGLQKEQKMPLRLNSVGALLLMLLSNVIFFARFGRFESLIFSLVLVYLLAIILAVRPVFSGETKSPANWTQDEMTWKAGLITLLVFLLRYLWGQFPESKFPALQSGESTVKLLLSISVLVPFYIGVILARLPIPDVKSTHLFPKAGLEKFTK